MTDENSTPQTELPADEFGTRNPAESEIDDASTDEPAAKKRSPLERIVVWLLIVGLVGILAVESRARIGYDAAREALEAVDAKTTLTLDEVRSLMTWGPTEIGPEKRRRIYRYEFSWFSLFRSGQYRIIVSTDPTDDEPYMVSFHSPEPGETLDLTLKGRPEGDGGVRLSRGTIDLPGLPMDEPPKPVFANGRGRLIVQHLDQDGDGELSTEEIEAAAFVLFSLDENGDGELTTQELLNQSDSPPEGDDFRGPESDQP